jgi:hypothetical protein
MVLVFGESWARKGAVAVLADLGSTGFGLGLIFGGHGGSC